MGCAGDAGVGAQVDLGAEKPLDEDVVAPCALAVQADGDLGVLEHLRELEAGELRALVAIEDVRSAMTAKCLLQSLDAEVPGDSGDRQPAPDRGREAVSAADLAPAGDVGDVGVAQTWFGRVTAIPAGRGGPCGPGPP